MKPDLKAWARKFETLTNSDETIAAMGKYYTCSFIFDMELERVLVEMVDGKVKRIDINPGPIDACDFILRASAASWREFAKPVPRPMFHGIWAAMFREDLRIEGNHLAMMKNLRNFTVQFELLRKSGVPV
jgi:hypothetical protein